MSKKIIILFSSVLILLGVIFIVNQILKPTWMPLDFNPTSIFENDKSIPKNNGTIIYSYKELKLEKSKNYYTQYVLVLYEECSKLNGNIQTYDKTYKFYKIMYKKLGESSTKVTVESVITLPSGDNEINSLNTISKDLKKIITNKNTKVQLENEVNKKKLMLQMNDKKINHK